MLVGRQPNGLKVNVALPDFWGELDYTTLVVVASRSFFGEPASSRKPVISKQVTTEKLD